MDTLQEINISHSGEKEKHLQNWHFRRYVSSQKGILYDFFRHQLGYQTISSWPLDLDRVHGPCRSFSKFSASGIPEQFPIKNPRKHSDSMRILWRFRFGDCVIVSNPSRHFFEKIWRFDAYKMWFPYFQEENTKRSSPSQCAKSLSNQVLKRLLMTWWKCRGEKHPSQMMFWNMIRCYIAICHDF